MCGERERERVCVCVFALGRGMRVDVDRILFHCKMGFEATNMHAPAIILRIRKVLCTLAVFFLAWERKNVHVPHDCMQTNPNIL